MKSMALRLAIERLERAVQTDNSQAIQPAGARALLQELERLAEAARCGIQDPSDCGNSFCLTHHSTCHHGGECWHAAKEQAPESEGTDDR